MKQEEYSDLLNKLLSKRIFDKKISHLKHEFQIESLEYILKKSQRKEKLKKLLDE